jgi:hypothetical protein
MYVVIHEVGCSGGYYNVDDIQEWLSKARLQVSFAMDILA